MVGLGVEAFVEEGGRRSLVGGNEAEEEDEVEEFFAAEMGAGFNV